MKVYETKDRSLIMSVLSVPEIWEALTDGANPEEFELPIDEDIFLIGEVDNIVIGCAIFEWANGVAKIHFQVKPEHRKIYSRDFGQQCIKWFFRHHNEDLHAKINHKYPNVINFARSFGFEEMGDDGQCLYLRLTR